jgi:hypothetical protein
MQVEKVSYTAKADPRFEVRVLIVNEQYHWYNLYFAGRYIDGSWSDNEGKGLQSDNGHGANDYCEKFAERKIKVRKNSMLARDLASLGW